MDNQIIVWETLMKAKTSYCLETCLDAEVRFVITITTGGSVKFLPAVKISLEKNIIFGAISTDISSSLINLFFRCASISWIHVGESVTD